MLPFMVNNVRALLPCRGQGKLTITPLDEAHVEAKMDECIPLQDGKEVKANVYLPKVSSGAQPRFPVLVHMVPYGKDEGRPKRGLLFDTYPLQYNLMKVLCGGDIGEVTLSEHTPWEAADPNTWCNRGYAVVQVDTRGFFCSQEGNEGQGGIISPREARDYQDVVRWLAKEANFSNGKVASIGVSYLAISQWNMAGGRKKHDVEKWGEHVPPVSSEHLACMVTWEGLCSFERGVCPGGAGPNAFFQMWTESSAEMNGGNPGGAMLNDQGSGLKGAKEAMAKNYNLYGSVDALAIAQSEPEGIPLDVPVLTCQSWSDQGVHNGDGFEAWQRLTSGSSRAPRFLYTHGRNKWAVFYDEAVAVIARFLDFYCKNEREAAVGAADSKSTGPWAGGVDRPVRLEVRESSEEHTVRYESEFPLKRAKSTDLFLQQNGSLTFAPAPASEEGPRAGLLAGSAAELDLASSSKKGDALLFDHKFETDTELSGYMALDLQVELDSGGPENHDAELFVLIEKLDAQKKEVYFPGVMGDTQHVVTVGEFRLSHYASLGEPDAGPCLEERMASLQPWYTHTERKPLKRGEKVFVSIPLRPSSTLFRKGEYLRLRVTASGQRKHPMISRKGLTQSGTLVVRFGETTKLRVPVVGSVEEAA